MLKSFANWHFFIIWLGDELSRNPPWLSAMQVNTSPQEKGKEQIVKLIPQMHPVL